MYIYILLGEEKKGAVEKYAGLSVAVELEYTCIYHFSFNKWRVVFQLENMAVSTALKTLVLNNRHCSAKKESIFHFV